MAESEPLPTALEQAISDAANEVFDSGKTGYNWTEVDDILSENLDIGGQTRCKKATDSGRAANVLTESNDKDIALYMVFVGPSYSIERFLPVAEDRIARFPKVRTVAVADKKSGDWRVRAIIERDGADLGGKLLNDFPLVSEVRKVDVASDEAPHPPPPPNPALQVALPLVPLDELTSAAEKRTTEVTGLETLPALLRQLATARGIRLDMSTAVDLLASTLASQLVLFAGPSGTGKSTLARLLMEFFADAERRFLIDGRRQWISPEDVSGYFSVLGSAFAATTNTPTLLAMHEVSTGAVSEQGRIGDPPMLLVEELNLSAPDGYCAPVMHGLSSLTAPIVVWDMHAEGSTIGTSGGPIGVPERLLFGPYPRFFGTINVDSSAMPPPRKFVGRSCVVLLEPEPLSSALLAGVGKGGPSLSAPPSLGDAAQWLGDPRAALAALTDPDRAMIEGALMDVMALVPSARLSQRDALRALAYMAYFILLLDPADRSTASSLAAENALLHFVLPVMEATAFTSTLHALMESDAVAAPPASDDELGGLLVRRVERLAEAADATAGFGLAMDFWVALS